MSINHFIILHFFFVSCIASTCKEIEDKFFELNLQFENIQASRLNITLAPKLDGYKVIGSLHLFTQSDSANNCGDCYMTNLQLGPALMERNFANVTRTYLIALTKKSGEYKAADSLLCRLDPCEYMKKDIGGPMGLKFEPIDGYINQSKNVKYLWYVYSTHYCTEM